ASGQSTSPDAYFATLTQGIDAIDGLERNLAAALHTLLTARVAALRADIRRTLTWAAIGLVAVRLAGFWVIRDDTVALAEVVTVANHIAAGDLSKTVQASSRRDELGGLGRA